MPRRGSHVRSRLAGARDHFEGRQTRPTMVDESAPLVRALVESDAPQEKLLIPQSALIADQQGIYVFVVEDGKVIFDMREAKYSLAAEHGRCTLHLWGEDRNLVRRVSEATLRNSALRLSAHRFGQTKPLGARFRIRVVQSPYPV